MSNLVIKDGSGNTKYIRASGAGSDADSFILERSISGSWVNVTLSLDTNVYADGDVLADTQLVAGCTPTNDKECHLKSAIIIDKDDQGYPLALLFFDSNVSLGTENSAPNISDANAVYYLGKVEIGTLDFDDLGGVRVAYVPCDMPVKPADGTDDVYMGVLSRGAGTYSASGIVVRLYFE
jgi:hypothetical protein